MKITFARKNGFTILFSKHTYRPIMYKEVFYSSEEDVPSDSVIVGNRICKKLLRKNFFHKAKVSPYQITVAVNPDHDISQQFNKKMGKKQLRLKRLMKKDDQFKILNKMVQPIFRSWYEELIHSHNQYKNFLQTIIREIILVEMRRK